MERLFTLLGNLDTGPSHRGTDQQAKPELLLQSTHLGKVGIAQVSCSGPYSCSSWVFDQPTYLRCPAVALADKWHG
jgi:hypothetical protein